MTTISKEKKLSDITIGELEEILVETLVKILDPDYGLEIRPEVKEDLRKSMIQKEKGKGVRLEEVKTQLEL